MKIVLLLIVLIFALILISVVRTAALKPKKADYHFSEDKDRSLAYGEKLAHMIPGV